MANDEHIALLKKGVDAWNAWRQKNSPWGPPDRRLMKGDDWLKWRDDNSDILPDLSEADLTQADLRTANLSGANLFKAQLSGPVPTGRSHRAHVVIMGLNLILDDVKNLPEHGADLSGANLSGANLQQANLRWAILTNADLTGADLSWALLRQASLRGLI